MSFGTGFRGNVSGAVQTAYTDQPGVAVAGMVAFASDINLKDAVYVGETDGVAAGRGVKYTALTDAISLQRPNVAAYLPTGAETAADLAGVVVFDEAMQSDEDGIPGWANGRMARILRPDRAGGRIYVAAIGAVEVTDTVYWVTSAGTQEVYAVGDFSAVALGGGAAGVTVAIPAAKWITPADAGGVAIVEFLGNAAAFD